VTYLRNLKPLSEERLRPYPKKYLELMSSPRKNRRSSTKSQHVPGSAHRHLGSLHSDMFIPRFVPVIILCLHFRKLLFSELTRPTMFAATNLIFLSDVWVLVDLVSLRKQPSCNPSWKPIFCLYILFC
jgi:hypothetical protein